MVIEEKENKYIFRKTEKQLYQYFEDLKKKEAIKKNIDDLNNAIDIIDDKIKECDVNFMIDIQAVGFDERVQTSSDGNSAVEKAVESQITALQREQKHYLSQLYKEEYKLRNLELKTNKMERVINMFNEDLKYFINLMYNLKLKPEKIADKIHVSKKTAYNIRDKIVKEIISFKMLQEVGNENILNARNTARGFIRNKATKEDLEELEVLIKERKENENKSL